jgi:hypothetical protein
VYISLDTDQDCYLLQGGPVLSIRRTPHDKTANVLTITQIWSCVPEGAWRQDWLTVKWLTLTPFPPIWRWRQHDPPKRRYPTTSLQRITPKKTPTRDAELNKTGILCYVPILCPSLYSSVRLCMQTYRRTRPHHSFRRHQMVPRL